jgi:hypothetical protein
LERTLSVVDGRGWDVGKMRILDSTGDTVVEWDASSEPLTRRAEAIFKRQSLSCQMAFARHSGGTAEEVERIRSFDPTAEEIIWVRPIQGG